MLGKMAQKSRANVCARLYRGSVFLKPESIQENMLSILLCGIIAKIVLPSGVYFGVVVANNSSIILFISLFDSGES